MKPFVYRVLAAVLAGLLLLGVVASLAPSASAAASPSLPTINCNTKTNLGEWEDKVLVYLGAETATTKPFLALGAPPTGAAQFQLTDPASAPTRAAGAISSNALPAPAVFTLGAPLAQNYYLNLSKPLIASIWLTSATLASTKDNMELRFELWLGAQRLGGQDCYLTVGGAGAAWHLMSLRFRPELRALTAGETLSLKVYTFSATSDLHIGTGGAHASYFELRYHPNDPLAGPVFLQDGKRYAGAPEPSEEGEAVNGSAWWLALGAVPGAFLVTRRSGRRLRVLFLGALLLGLGFAGCLAPEKALLHNEPGEEPPPESTAEITVTETKNETLEEEKMGVLKGSVKDEIGIAVADAHVLLMGTSLFTRTDKDGAFAFPNLVAGKYVLRVDREPYLSLETEVTVEVGKETNVQVTLARPATTTNNLKPHLHDVFDEDGKKLLWDGSVLLSTYQAEGAAPPAAGWTCVWGERCEAQIPIDYDVPMPSGTSWVEIIPKFSGVSGYQQVGLRVLTPLNATGSGFGAVGQDFVPRGTNDPFRVAIFPEEADPGHQQFTNWVYFLWVMNTGSPFNPFGQPVSRGAALNVQIIAHKGVVPYEPAHKDLWADRTEMTLVNGVQRLGTANANDYPRTDIAWQAATGSFAPTGTSEIRGTLTWATKNGEPSPHTWSIVYKSARYPTGAPVFKKPDTVTPGTGKVDFIIKVDPLDVDAFYSRRSGWFFYPDDNAAALPAGGVSPNFGAETKWTLTATAYRDPAYVAE